MTLSYPVVGVHCKVLMASDRTQTPGYLVLELAAEAVAAGAVAFDTQPAEHSLVDLVAGHLLR